MSSIPLSLVSRVLGAPRRSPARGVMEFSEIFTDSRAPSPGGLFVAVRGETFDGHAFVRKALEAGAAGAICERQEASQSADFENKAIFEVDNTTEALRRLASAWREQFDIPIAAVVGSVGKTTTKEALAAILAGKFGEVLKTHASENGYLGVALTLLRLRPEHGAAVIEIGIDEPGAMASHLGLVRPTAVVLSALGPEHLEKLRDMETVVQEEVLALSWTLEHGGQAAVNLDDRFLKGRLASLDRPGAVGFTLSSRAASDVGWHQPVSVGEHSESRSGTQLTVRSQDDQVSIPLPAPGEHLARNVLGAWTLAQQLGLNPGECQRGFREYRPPPGRNQLSEAAGVTFILDYYNSNPASVLAGLQSLRSTSRRPGRTGVRWVCLADMLELGSDSRALHEGLADSLLREYPEHVLLLGPQMRFLYDRLAASGYAGRLVIFDAPGILAQFLANAVQKGDTVYIKGSRGMRMELVWNKVQELFSKPTPRS